MNNSDRADSATRKANLIIFDFNRTLYDPDVGKLFPGVLEMLEVLRSSTTKLVVATKVEQARHEIIVESNLSEYVEQIINLNEKTVEGFMEIAKGFKKESVYVVGDVLSQEIRIGRECGFHTIWLAAGKFADMDAGSITPDHEIHDITEVCEIILRQK